MGTWGILVEAVSWVLILSGAFFTLVGAFGIWRFPDFWSRLHAASVADSAGMILLFAGMCVHSGLTLVTVKLIIIGIFLFVTGPTATHAVANAALTSGLRPTEAPGLVGAAPKTRSKTEPETEPGAPDTPIASNQT